jgi:2-iminobutanoate/2-iminopropanoate deaminase
MSGIILSINKETMSLGMPWEKEYGYSQAVKVGDTIYVSGQVAHDDNGKIVGRGEMEAQMRQAYSNIHKVLAQYGATMDNIVDERCLYTNSSKYYLTMAISSV